MTLQELEALGAYMNAGFVDYYDGNKHNRLGMVTAGGDVVLTPEGEALALSLVPSTVKKLKARKQQADASPPPASDSEDTLLSELDSLLP